MCAVLGVDYAVIKVKLFLSPEIMPRSFGLNTEMVGQPEVLHFR